MIFEILEPVAVVEKKFPRGVNFYFHTVTLQPNSRSRHPSTRCLVKSYRGSGTSPGSVAPRHHRQPAPQRTHMRGPVHLLHMITSLRKTWQPSKQCKFFSCQYGSHRGAAADMLGIKCAIDFPGFTACKRTYTGSGGLVQIGGGLG